MNDLRPLRARPSPFLWVVAILALVVAVYGVIVKRQENSAPGGFVSPLISTIEGDGILRAGYGVYPPFTVEDPVSGAVTGVSVDFINELGRQLGKKVIWKRFNWNTMSADLKRKSFDILADAIFETPDRALEFTFTDAYAYIPLGIGVVRRNDTRFHHFDDINTPTVSVAVGQGFAEESFVKARAPQAMLISVPSGQDTAAALNLVLSSRADIAITNLADAQRFTDAHPTALQMLWADHPPAYVPVGFALNHGDQAGADLLNVTIANFRSTGITSAILKRYGTAIRLSPPPPSD